MTPQRRSILLVSSNFPPVIGGSSVVYDQICRNAADDIVAIGSRNNHETGQEWDNIDALDATSPYLIHRVKFLRPPATTKRRHIFDRLFGIVFDDLPVMASVLIFIVRYMIQYRVKVVCIGELISGGWLVFPLRYIFGRKVLIYTHGEEISQTNDTTLGRMRLLFLRHADGIIAVSSFCKSQIVSIFGIDARKIAIIPNGVDLATFCRGDADPAILPESLRGRPVVLSVSRLVERKGQEFLIRAFPAILERVPDACCIIVGTGPLSAHLRKLVDELGLAQTIIFMGGVEQDDLIKLYRSCSLFALPCRTLPDGDTEGFGLVFLEANASGLAVVGGAAGGTIEAVLDNETGLLVDGSDSTQIADAISRLLTDRSLRDRLSSTGWKRTQNWGWPGVTKKFLDLCNEQIPQTPTVHPSFPAPSRIITDQTNQPRRTFRPKLLVTVDVEEEFVWTEFSRDRYRVRGVDALEEFHLQCRSLGISPVYLITYPILKDPEFGRFLDKVLNEGSAEVGIHVHAWTTPPYWEQTNAYNSFQCNLPEHVERRKIEFLIRAYEERFKRPVTIHRAGRWGGGTRTSQILAELGIQIDLSPSTGYALPEAGGPDFSNIDGHPFWAESGNKVLALPASSISYLRGPDWISAGAFRFHNYASHIQRWGTSVRFSPEGQSTSLLTAMSRQLALRKLPIAIFALHSTSLYPAGNPYSATLEDTVALRQRSFDVLKNAVEIQQFIPTTCQKIRDEYRAAELAESVLIRA